MPQRQLKPSRPPSPLVFLLISTHFTATLGIPLSSPALKKSSFNPLTGLSPALLRLTYFPTCAPFTPNNSGQRSPPTYYRGCWHVVSRGFLPRYRHFLRPGRQQFTTRRPSSCTRHCSVTLSRIAEDSRLQPPVGVWAVSQSQCG